ncbi:hypothetical protein DL93DRAFT_2169689 [Clavulina sp. PMI_390]|nr:hypothetical protein DL93DRAFT_2169689 [Clavulina sp. PMI_390]
MNKSNIGSVLHLDINPALLAVNSLLEIVDSRSPSELNLTPILVLRGDERSNAQSSVLSAISSIDSTLDELSALITVTTRLCDKVRNWRLWVSQPLSGVRALPEELLRDIFTLAVNSSFSTKREPTGWRTAIAISQTCSLWRTASIECSVLWDSLKIKHPSHMSLIPVFASRSSMHGLTVAFGESSSRSRHHTPWCDLQANSLPIHAQDAEHIREVHFHDAIAIKALSFSPESLENFRPKWCKAELSRYPERLSGNFPQYFLQSQFISLLGLFHPIQPLDSTSLTTLYLNKASQSDVRELIEISNAPSLSFLQLKNSRFIWQPHGDDDLAVPPAVSNSIETLELVDCFNKFTQTLTDHVVFPRLRSLSIIQEFDITDKLGALSITPLMRAFPLLRKLSLSMPHLRQALEVLNFIAGGPHDPLLPELLCLKIISHCHQRLGELLDENLDRLQSWVHIRLQTSTDSGAEISPLEELHLSEDFIGNHRGWYETHLPAFSIHQSAQPSDHL